MKYSIKEVLASGYVKGLVVSFKYKKTDDEVLSKDREYEKLVFAIQKTKTQFDKMIEDNKDLKEYLITQQLIATDPDLKRKCESRIKIGLSCKAAVYDVMNQTTEEILKSTSAYLRERALDVNDVCLRIINNIDSNGDIDTPNKFILRVEDLYPSLIIQKRDSIIGIIADKGGYTSHSAIMCRAFDIPLVLCDDSFDVKNNDTVIIDTRTKTLNLNPTPEEITEFDKEYEIRNRYPKMAIPHEGYKFLANISTNYELDKVVDYGYDGVGLYRTELIFMNSDRPYTFYEQTTIYLEACEKLKNKTVTFRTFDVGDDKNISYLNTDHKGIDNYKNNVEIFETQVKAILTANQKYNNAYIMFPMIHTNKEFQFLRKWVTKISKKEHLQLPKIGMMLETKEALENIKSFKNVDFISVGTNDLTHELYNIDRQSALNDLTYLPDLLEKLKNVVDFTNKKGISLSVCGELSSIKESAVELYKIGVKNLSLSPSLIRTLNMSFEEFNSRK